MAHETAGAGPRIGDDPPEILLVEDSATQAKRMQWLLEKNGYAVTVAVTAQAAMEALRNKLPSLLITDFNLPDFNGAELCRRARINAGTQVLPILMLTSEADSEVELAGLQSGADDYLSKASSVDVLLLRVQALIKMGGGAGRARDAGGAPFQHRLLLVEDSPTFLALLANEFASEGYEIHQAVTGAAALEKLAELTFDAVILDLILPDMRAFEVCRQVRANPQGDQPPPVLLILTAQETETEIAQALESGADDVVGKSRDLSVVKLRVRSLLRRRAEQREREKVAAQFQAKESQLELARLEAEVARSKLQLAEQLVQKSVALEQANRELKEAQTQLVQAAKMASLGQLVAGIAHEINNPLAFVINHQDTIKRNVSEVLGHDAATLPEDSTRRLEKVISRLVDSQEGLARISDIVVKLRTFSRLDEGELKYVRIDECIESTITLLHYRLGGRIGIERNYGEPRIVPCFPGPLNQVIMNILSNAIDAIDGPGKITIETGRDGDMLAIAITDTGQGIPDEVRERIFEPFFTTKPVGSGTGLGLSISYGVIKRHGGRIDVASRPGAGTTITVRIPVEQREPAPAPG